MGTLLEVLLGALDLVGLIPSRNEAEKSQLSQAQRNVGLFVFLFILLCFAIGGILLFFY